MLRSLRAGRLLALAALGLGAAGTLSGCRMLFGRAPSQTFVAGVVTSRFPLGVPRDATVRVSLEAMQPDSTFQAIQTIEVPRNGRPFPFPYRLAYPAGTIESATTYVLRAVADDGRGDVVASPRVPVLTQGGGRSADLILGGTAEATIRLRVAPPTPSALPGASTAPRTNGP